MIYFMKAAMPWWGWLIIGIAALLIAAIVFILNKGKKMQAQQAEAQKQMDAAKQTITMLIIDKQKKRMRESGLPEAAIEAAPKYARRLKIPVVKAKVQNQVRILIADAKVFDVLPVKKTVTCSVSGLYITEIKSVRGGSVPKMQEKKKSFMEKLREKAMKSN